MFKTRRTYWSCTPLANRIRGVDKPNALQMGEWREWHTFNESRHPIRYWIAEEGLDALQDIVYYPYDVYRSVRSYVLNRFVDRTHSMLSHSLKKGEYHDFDARLLHSVFDEIVNFVEEECAWMHVVFDDENYKKYKARRIFPFQFRRFRSAEAGVAYLKWASGLVFDEDWLEKDDSKLGQPTPQAIDALWLLDAYYWWTMVRPNRPDPYEVSGFSEAIAGKPLLSEPTEDTKVALKTLDEMEEEYYKEDTKWLMEVVERRRTIWT